MRNTMRLRTISLLASLLLFCGWVLSGAVLAANQPVSSITIDYESAVAVPLAHREALEQALVADSELLPKTDSFAVTAVREVGEWTEYTLLPSHVLTSNWDTYIPPEVLRVAVSNAAGGPARAYLIGMGSEQITLPGAEVSPPIPLPNAPAADAFKFPWTSGHTWYKMQGWHGGAIDLAPPTGGDYSVLAASNGSVRVTCNDSYQVTMAIDNDVGTTTYIHLAAAGARTDLAGKSVPRGQYLGRTYDGTAKVNGACNPAQYPNLQWNTACGCGYGAHVHFIPPNQSLTIDGNNINTVATSDNGSPWTSTNTRVDNTCCGCSSSLAAADAPPLGGAPVGPPAPGSEPVVAYDLTAPGARSAAPPTDNAVIVDASPPRLDVADPAAAWTNSAARLAFTWPAATDEGSGVAGYRVYWGPDENGTSETLVVEPSYAPTSPDTGSGAVVYYLRIAPLDKAGNLGQWRTVNAWRYDALAPTGGVTVNGGEVVPMLPVTLSLSAADAHSGVVAMRFSADGANWTDWEPYTTARGWQLADVAGPQSVYVQFRDAAGNTSSPASAAVTADLTLAPPSSTNYRIVHSVMGTGGGAKQSNGYRLSGTSGQPFQTGSLQSNNYRLSSGYWAQQTAAANQPPAVPCNPTPANAATNVAVAAGLSWSGSDPNNDPLSYQIRFGTANPPPQVVAGQSVTSYDPPGDLVYSTTYYWQVVANDGRGGVTAGPVWSFTTAATPPAFPNVFYLSPAGSGTIAGIAYTGSDILRYTKSTNTWAMFFDGSDVGVTKNVSAFTFLPGGEILLSFAANQALSGLGTFTAHDVARFYPTQTGNTTSGTFAWYFDGSDVGLSTTTEKIDALDALSDGRLLISATGAVAVPGPAKQQDEDVLAFTFTPTGIGQTTGGTWAAFFNGTAVTGLGVEDVNAFWIDETTWDRYLTIVGTFNLSGVTGNGKSIVKLLAVSNAPSVVTWTYPPFIVDGLELVR